MITVGQIQSLRMLARSYKHFYTLRHWHDKVAWAIDNAEEGLRQSMHEKGVRVELPDGSVGYVELDEVQIAEVTRHFSSSKVQELKGVWNMINYEDLEWKKQSALLIKAASVPYHNYIPWDNWDQAMQFLAYNELLLRKDKSEEKEDA